MLVDWAPWHHTAAGNHDFGLVLYNGGSYYIDEGKPMPGAIETTVRNLREIAPTWYFNVPRGFEALLPYLRTDAQLRSRIFSRGSKSCGSPARPCRSTCSTRSRSSRCAHLRRGDSLPHRLRRDRDRARDAMGRMWPTANVANMGLPPPGAEVKLVPMQDKFEVRVKGPHITPGYWRQPELTRAGVRRGRLLPARRCLRLR